MDASGLVDLGEEFNPATRQFRLPPPTGATTRAYPSDTLLTDGRVLIAGGITLQGQLLHELEAWDSRANRTETLPIGLEYGRRNHVARLLANGDVDSSGRRWSESQVPPIVDPFERSHLRHSEVLEQEIPVARAPDFSSALPAIARACLSG